MRSTPHKSPMQTLQPLPETELDPSTAGLSSCDEHAYRRPKVSFDHNERSETSTEASIKSRHGFFSEFELVPPPPLTSTYSLQRLSTVPRKSTCRPSSVLPILTWLPHYSRGWFKRDIMAGITVSILQVPQVLAYAQLAGLPPEWGLYASIVPVILYSIWSTSTNVAVGPGAPSAIMLASAVNAVIAAKYGEDNENQELYQSIAMTFTFMCGVVFIILGILRAGFVVVFLSRPVMTGFIMSASFIIMLSQCKALFGLDIGRYPIFYENLIGVIENIGTIHWITTCISIGSLIILFIPKWVSVPRWVPVPLLVMIVNIVLSYMLGFEDMGVDVIGADIQSGFIMPKIPDLSFAKDVLPSALIVTVVDYMSNIVLAKSFEQKAQNTYREELNKGLDPIPLAPVKVDANMEFMAYGIANLFGSWFNCQIISASFSRTALNAEMSAQTRVAGLFRALLCILCCLFLMPLLAPLPKCVLAAVVCTAVYRLMKSGVLEALLLWKVSKLELIEFGVSVFAPLLIGMEMGIFLAIATSLIVNSLRHTFANVIFLGELTTNDGDCEYVDTMSFKEAKPVHGIAILEMKAELSFTNNLRLMDKIRELLADGERFIVVSLNLTSFIDTSTVREIMVLYSDAKESYICLSQCRPKVVHLIRRYKSSCDYVPNVKTFVSTGDAVRYLKKIRKKEMDGGSELSTDEDMREIGVSVEKVPLSPTPKLKPVTVIGETIEI